MSLVSLVGKTIVGEFYEDLHGRVLVFSDGTGFLTEHESVLAVERVDELRRDAVHDAELSWLHGMEQEWLRDPATSCEQRRDWRRANGGWSRSLLNRLSRNDERLVALGFFSELPVYCATCGETFCPGGREGVPGPSCDMDTLLRASYAEPLLSAFDDPRYMLGLEDA